MVSVNMLFAKKARGTAPRAFYASLVHFSCCALKRLIASLVGESGYFFI